MPVARRLGFHLETGQVRHVGAAIAANHISPVLTHEAVLVPLATTLLLLVLRALDHALPRRFSGLLFRGRLRFLVLTFRRLKILFKFTLLSPLVVGRLLLNFLQAGRFDLLGSFLRLSHRELVRRLLENLKAQIERIQIVTDAAAVSLPRLLYILVRPKLKQLQPHPNSPFVPLEQRCRQGHALTELTHQRY